mgnify:CR=1 FL=1
MNQREQLFEKLRADSVFMQHWQHVEGFIDQYLYCLLADSSSEFKGQHEEIGRRVEIIGTIREDITGFDKRPVDLPAPKRKGSRLHNQEFS